MKNIYLAILLHGAVLFSTSVSAEAAASESQKYLKSLETIHNENTVFDND